MGAIYRIRRQLRRLPPYSGKATTVRTTDYFDSVRAERASVSSSESRYRPTRRQRDCDSGFPRVILRVEIANPPTRPSEPVVSTLFTRPLARTDTAESSR